MTGQQQTPQRTADELAAVLDERLTPRRWKLRRITDLIVSDNNGKWLIIDEYDRIMAMEATLHATLLAAVEQLKKDAT